MADAVRVTNVVDGPRNLIVELTNVSDGTGESTVAKVDVSALSPPCDTVRIDCIEYSTNGMEVDLLWDATANVLAWHIPADQEGCQIFGPQGLQNPKTTGYTGDILLTTTGHASGDVYTIKLHCKKQGVTK
jgi:hypothetical protein